MKKYIFLFFLVVFGSNLYSQDKFACFQNDKKTELQISVCFDKDYKAKYVKYKGKDETIPLFYSKKEKSDIGGAKTYWAVTYVEKYRGVITGTYVFTNAGSHGLDVTFKRAKDGKEFYFVIIEELLDTDGETYLNRPCF